MTRSLREWLHDRLENRRFSSGLFTAATVWGIVAAIGILLYTGWSPPKITVALIAAFAAGAIGAFIGFLFGVPIARSDGARETRAQDGTFKPNTNLEQVSDWSTKIIVGVSLIQFREIGAAVYTIGTTVGDAIGSPTSAPNSASTFGIALVVGSSLVAFLLCYMWTTTRLYDVFITGNDQSRAVNPLKPGQAAAQQQVTGGRGE